MHRKSYSYGILALLLVVGLANAAWAASPTDRAVQVALQKQLSNSNKFADVQVNVEDLVATLTGTVASYLDKNSATRKARKYGALTRVTNLIQVAGPTVADEQLAEKLARKLSYDGTFQGNVFDVFRLSVKNGVVTVSGYAHNYRARNSALALTAAAKGVKGVVDQIEVLPLSRHDDGIRLAAVRSIYGNPALRKYGVDPVHPIRVIVRNGHLTLEGVVVNSVDRKIANLAVSTIGGVFSVTNNLRVEST